MSNVTKISPSINGNIYFDEEVWLALLDIASNLDYEFTALGFVTQEEENRLYVNNIFFPNQVNTKSTTELDSKLLLKKVHELQQQGLPTENIKCWIHSHGKHDVYWSETDEKNIKDMLLGDSQQSALISIVINQRKEYKARIDVRNSIYSKGIFRGQNRIITSHVDCVYNYFEPLGETEIADLKKNYKEKAKENDLSFLIRKGKGRKGKGTNNHLNQFYGYDVDDFYLSMYNSRIKNENEKQNNKSFPSYLLNDDDDNEEDFKEDPKDEVETTCHSGIFHPYDQTLLYNIDVLDELEILGVYPYIPFADIKSAINSTLDNPNEDELHLLIARLIQGEKIDNLVPSKMIDDISTKPPKELLKKPNIPYSTIKKAAASGCMKHLKKLKEGEPSVLHTSSMYAFTRAAMVGLFSKSKYKKTAPYILTGDTKIETVLNPTAILDFSSCSEQDPVHEVIARAITNIYNKHAAEMKVNIK